MVEKKCRQIEVIVFINIHESVSACLWKATLVYPKVVWVTGECMLSKASEPVPGSLLPRSNSNFIANFHQLTTIGSSSL